MKPVSFLITAAVLTAFGLITVFLGSSVILDLFDIRAREGNYVLFIVWANLISGILFLTAAVGFLMRKSWAARPLIVSLAVLVIAFIGLMFHINSGAAYETRTIGAMIFRMAVNVTLAFIVYSALRRQKRSALARTGLLALIPLSLLLANCQQGSDKGTDDGNAVEEAHHHDEHGQALSLDNGERWKADDHTRSVVEEMKSELLDFEGSAERDYTALSDSLTNQLNALIAGCTMKGPAHDALHQWLGPVTENVKVLSATEDASTASTRVDALEESLNSFDTFFQPEE